MGFGALRVINEDRVAPSAGFPTHPHRDMEIISYVLAGGLEHRDSMGHGSVIRPGDVQRMSAGTGVFHSEFNASESELVHFLQIWIVPDRRGLAPSYEQRHYEPIERRGRLRPIATPDGRDESVTIHQDACVYAGLFDQGEAASHSLAPGHRVWVHVARGDAVVRGEALQAGDALAIVNDTKRPLPLRIEGRSDADVLLFDLAA
jgi:redox-sensitive bicupin YhaK (pirin superfamily)